MKIGTKSNPIEIKPKPAVPVASVIKPDSLDRETREYLAPVAASALDAQTNRLADLIELPTQKYKPAKNIYDFAYLIYAAQKTGKTSFSMQFPEVAHLFYEPSGEDYEVLSVEPPDWEWFKAYVVKCERLKEAGELPYKMFALDVADIAYMHALKSVCVRLTKSDFLPDDYGKTQAKVDEEFRTWMIRLRRVGGLIFLSHVKTEQFEKANGKKQSRYVPSAMKKCTELLARFCTLTGYYHIDAAGDRVLAITPHADYEAGNRFENHFNYKGSKEKVSLIYMGTSAKEAYENFLAGFNNELEKPAEETSNETK